jgi:nucleoid-associated protein YgaU
MRSLTVFVLAACVSISSLASAATQLIAGQTVAVPHGNYAQSDNPSCPPNGFNMDDPSAMAIAVAGASVTAFPVGMLIPLATVIAGDLASVGGDIAKAIVPASARHSSCASLALRLPPNTRNAVVRVYASEGGGGFGECTQVEGAFRKCPTGWSAWTFLQKGDVVVATAKNWSHNRARVFRIEVYGDVWQSSHTVVKGESLWTIAKAAYGNAESWLQLFKANEKKLGDEPDSLFPGMILVIPPPKGW